MGERTSISWTRSTWNPWMGCTKVSPGCQACYMFRDMRRYGRNPEVVTRARPHTFHAPLKWKDGRLIFTCSWSDFFHHEADAWRPEAWDIIRRTPHHTYQILTKRPGRIPRHLPDDWGEGYPNVWIGTSVEHQDTQYRIRQLLYVPALVRFISAEPLIGPLNLGLLGTAPFEVTGHSYVLVADFIHWVIVGGESGPDGVRREMSLTWAMALRDECRDAGVPFHFKQRSGPRPGLIDGVPSDLLIRDFPEMWHAR